MDPDHAGAEHQARAHGTMGLGKKGGHGRRDGAAHRMLRRFQHRHLMAQRAGRGGEFQPDEAGPDHHHMAGAGEPRLEIVGVSEGA